MKIKNTILASGTLIGSIIGAGIFGIPYVLAKSGILLSLAYFIVLTLVVLLLHLSLGEISLRTKEKHRLVGYAGKYLGKKAKLISGFSVIFGTVGSLLSYIILAGSFLSLILPFSVSSFNWSIFFWGIMSFFVYLGIKSIAKIETLLNTILFGAFFLIFALSLPEVKLVNYSLFNGKYFLLPFGIVLFSLVGWNAVPEVEAILVKKRKLKQVIVFSTLIAAVFYFIFGLIISGVTGQQTTQEAFQGLLPFLGRKIIVLGGIFGLLAVSTSFLVLANYLKNTLVFDYRFPYFFAFSFASLAPLLLFLGGIREFISVIAFVGAFVGLIDGTIITLSLWKAKQLKERQPEYSLSIPRVLTFLTIAVLALGAVSQIIYYLL
jgi:tyrosine-specific transport protein